ncbi:CCR4-Not complex caf1 ribonuclease subunit Caf1 [Orobanche gracilis]
MAVKSLLLAPPQLLPFNPLARTEISFSRWNNGNAQKFIRHHHTQQEIEGQLRFQKRTDSALTISHNYSPAPRHTATFKSTGTSSAPFAPPISGKSSKCSENPSLEPPHPAFKPRKIPVNYNRCQNHPQLNSRIDENGVSYEIPEAPFVYQYSYTDTPKVKPVKLREPLMSPFGPVTMSNPWLGRKPIPPSKKKHGFDSFQLPPSHKKGVKPVQAPGPFVPGSGPKYAKSLEEVLGEPLTKEEIEELIRGCKKSSRQLNIGRDGLTHNMLDNIHALWKRRRVCKIKCKGVCIVDMVNVCQQLEEKTGGKIIYNSGGVIYLFHGRNYNYKSRPQFPLMLWKPVTPVYPRLIQRVPEGLTLEEATDMRRRGRNLTPICKLAKNGVYSGLVKNVREAFEACELVRINCQGLNASDYKRTGAKLKDLVPCVLLSFECEHILMWRGRDWKTVMELNESVQEVKADDVATSGLLASPIIPGLSGIQTKSNDLKTNICPESDRTSELSNVGMENIMNGVPDVPVIASHAVFNGDNIEESEKLPVFGDNHSEAFDRTVESHTALENAQSNATVSNLSQPKVQLNCTNEQMSLNMPCTEEVVLLREQAVEIGLAFVLDDQSLDADAVFKKSVAFAKTAPSGPVFRQGHKQLAAVHGNKEQVCDDGSGPKEAGTVLGIEITVFDRRNERKSSRNENMKISKGDYLNVVPQGNLSVDELAKLLA